MKFSGKNTFPPAIAVPPASGVAVGIDVGGPSKGFHAVALREGRFVAKYAASDPASIGAWCRATGALVIGIDAPCRWRSSQRVRSAEQELASGGISCFITPDSETAASRPFYQWMVNGAGLYRTLEPDYPLFAGDRDPSGRASFETFPQAVVCALAEKIVPAKRKSVVRRELLGKAGIDLSPLTNMDTVDAALCALAAHYFLAGSIKAYGDARDGLIIVPAP